MLDSYDACNIIKEYSGVRILHGINFRLQSGTIHGLFGHNGAGKSTLLKVMAGVEKPEDGTLQLNGETITLSSPQVALSSGIACVYQELRLIPDLTVMENIFLGREFGNKFGIINEKYMLEYSKQLLEKHNINVNPKEYVKNLTHPIKQIIEVIINLDRKAKFIILDEPTTALESKQSDILLKDVQKIVRKNNIGVAIVSHKIDEVLPYCDEVSVMSGGKMLFNAKSGNFSKKDIVDSIIGKKENEKELIYSKTDNEFNIDYTKPFLEVKNLSTLKLKNINLRSYKGEILGIYGLVGSGRTSFCHTMYGIYKADSGDILIDGNKYEPKDPLHAIKTGISYLTEDRKHFGIIPLMSAIINSSITSLQRFSNGFNLNYTKLDKQILNTLEKIQIKGNVYNSIKSLSGGNQQKALLARIIEENSNLLLLDEPTKGVDLGAKADIYNIIRSLAKLGKSIIIVSSEEEELVETADRVIIFKDGQCRDIVLKGSDITVTNLRESVF